MQRVIATWCLVMGSVVLVQSTADAAVATSSIAVTINASKGATVVPPDTTVVVTGTASGSGTGLNVIYVVDVSGSTSGPGGLCGDQNGDGSADEIIDCEIAAIVALNNSLGRPNVDVSLVAFSSTGDVQDLSPAAGVQTRTQPTTDADANGSPDVVDALRSLRVGGGTDFDAALSAVQTLLAPGEEDIVVFLSDGESPLATGPGSALQAVVDAGATIFTFSVGAGAVGCGGGSPLQEMADSTGGTCTELVDPSQLSGAVSSVNLSGIDRVEIEVNGLTHTATLGPGGGFAGVVPAASLRVGRNSIVVRAYGAGAHAGQVATAETFVIRQGPANRG